jgi:hypothetical protein
MMAEGLVEQRDLCVCIEFGQQDDGKEVMLRSNKMM